MARIMCRELAVSHPCGLVIDTEHVSGLHVQSGMCLNARAVHRNIQIYKKRTSVCVMMKKKSREGRKRETEGTRGASLILSANQCRYFEVVTSFCHDKPL